MRLGVLDVGSNTVHLLVMDAHPGARPLPAHSHKAELRLAELLDGGGGRGPPAPGAHGWARPWPTACPPSAPPGRAAPTATMRHR
ncbi:hypothetical protein ACFWMG_48210, partial [Streptomyces sp. NPDC127074]